MKMKFGAIVVDGRGKIGGHVASKNRAGAYLRTKVTPVNPQTTSQLTVRNRFTGLSQAWRGLTQANRDAWNAAVSDYQKTDIFGDLRNPTGFNLYQRLNNNLLNIGIAAIAAPPLPGVVQAVVLTSIAAAAGAGTMAATYAPEIDAATKVKVFATAPQSAGKSFVKAEYRQIDVIVTADASPFSIETEYAAVFGSVGVAGQKVFMKFIPVNLATGQTGTASQASAVVTA